MTYQELIESTIRCSQFEYYIPYNARESLSFIKDCKDKPKSKITVVGDWDVDGVLSAKIICNTLDDLNINQYEVYFGQRKTHGIDSRCVDYCLSNGSTHVIIVDSSSNNLDEIKYLSNLGIKVLIIDHHICEYTYDDYPENSLIINCKMPGNNKISKLSAGFLTFLVTSFWRVSMSRITKTEDLVLGYITLISDSCELSDDYIKPIILGVASLTNSIPVQVRLFMDQYSVLSRNFLTYRFNNKINTVCRYDNSELLMKLFFTNNELKDKIEAVEEINKLHDQTKVQVAELIESSEYFIEDVGSSILVNLDTGESFTELPKNFLTNSTGLIGSKIATMYGKAAITYKTWDKDTYKVSGRDCGENFPFQELLKVLDLDGGGHVGAVGFSIPKCDIDNLKEHLSSLRAVSKEKQYLELVLSNFTEMSMKSIVTQISKYNEISGGHLKPIYLKIRLDSKFFKKDVGRLRMFTFGSVVVKDLKMTKNLGDIVLISPSFNIEGEALVVY